ncbi:MAG: gamma-glutamylcyclotransferase [Alphaproteobacteria bacterium]|nr:gamma-glutamylcyclotransferase [Alphaproteobacteria bacterium]
MIGTQGLRRLLVAVVCAITFDAGLANAADWAGHHLENLPTNYVFGYGSLINSPSRNATLRSMVTAIPVRVLAAFGYVRTWNEHNPTARFTALGLRKIAAGEPGNTINGVIYPVDDQQLADNDDREIGYIRAEIPPSQIEAVGWERLPEAGHIWIYVPKEATAGGPSFDYPLLQTYIDVVIEGGFEHSPEFAREILDTTEGWSPFWLNDRELARRPWVRDPDARKVDQLLASTPATAMLYANRKFPETYAETLKGAAAR